MSRVKDKVAIVTGGGSGIGRATAILLATEGAKVVVTDIDTKKSEETAEEIKQKGKQAVSYQHDVVSEEDWQRVINQVGEVFGVPEILVNNAGLLLYKELSETTIEDWYKLMDVNALGVFLGMKHCAPLMGQHQKGSIVNISSTAGLLGVPRQTLYGASKGAVRVMTKDAAMEFASKQVRINSVHPSIVDTQMADYGAQERGKSKEELGKMYPLGSIGEPIDVAYGVLFLCSDESKFITGTELVIDGGYAAQ
ncbi:MAG: glucose 1-dehydrogenase [Cyanobacteriota bacterium]|nr:glucose 1-dehydrogenase [Cyanobacteriota bacterium]